MTRRDIITCIVVATGLLTTAPAAHAEPIEMRITGLVAFDPFRPPDVAPGTGGGLIRNVCHELFTVWPLGSFVDIRMTGVVEPNGPNLWRMEGPASLRLDGEMLPYYDDGILVANILGSSDPSMAELVQIGPGTLYAGGQFYAENDSGDGNLTALVLEVTPDMPRDVYNPCVMRFETYHVAAVPVPEPSTTSLLVSALALLTMRVARSRCRYLRR